MQKAARGFAKIMAVLIVLAVAAFGDVMYIIEMQKIFSGQGILLVFCYLGAFTSFAAIGYLLLGKSVVFRPGGQMLGAWIVFGVELLIIGLNILLVFNPDHSGLMGVWAFVSPATPVLHMLGVALLYFLDPELRDKHHAMEIQEKMDKSVREADFEIFDAGIQLRRKQTEHLAKALEKAVNSPESLAAINNYATGYNLHLLSEMTGMSGISAGVPAGLPAPNLNQKVVEADQGSGAKKEAVAMAQTDSVPIVPSAPVSVSPVDEKKSAETVVDRGQGDEVVEDDDKKKAQTQTRNKSKSKNATG
jgi:hypothetical protein